jgi:hypothetical protein
LGPFWQEPEPSQATGTDLARCILGKFLGVDCHCFPLSLEAPTSASRCLHVPINAIAPSSERWNCGREFCRNDAFFTPFRDLLHAVNQRHGANGFTSFPKEGMLRIFSPEKSDGFGRETLNIYLFIYLSIYLFIYLLWFLRLMDEIL